MVRAKFTCRSKVENETDGSANITLEPVVCGSEENKEFYKYTPCGRIELGVLNSEASKQFEQGKEYYVDFTKA